LSPIGSAGPNEWHRQLLLWILSLTAGSHPWTFGLATIALRIGEFQVIHYKKEFNRPRPSSLSPALMRPIEVPEHALAIEPDRSCGPLQRMAERIARNRDVLGLPYPSDSGAEKQQVKRSYALLMKCDTMKVIVDRAKAEWQHHSATLRTAQPRLRDINSPNVR
jgi:hypothetical protein